MGTLIRALAVTALGAVLLVSTAEARERPRRRAVPEFDPATAGAVTALITAGALLLARRRKGP